MLTSGGMANEFFQPGGRRATRVGDLFGAIAHRYDLINDLQSLGLHRRWKRRVVDLALVRPGDRVLDLCCGTGDLAFLLAQRGARVVGLDFSGPMLGVAAGRSRRWRDARSAVGSPSGLGPGGDADDAGLAFLRGDAMRIPLPDGCCDAVAIGYGLRNLADFRVGLEEMWRVTKPGGRVLVLDFGKPPNRIWRALYFSYLQLCVPVCGSVFCGNAAAYAYILESLKHYPAQDGVAAGMRELGAKHTRVVNLLGGAMSINYGEKA
jgi:demethylmenaquinone methyltransferase/2-methoxy-6-polyprenyl-1,4-benzoquinol methylase